MDDGLNLPKSAYVNKFIAKSKFYEKVTLNSKLQKEFTDKIQRITWKYKLAEETIGISKTDTVTEIQIFEISLKEQVIPKNVLKVIDKTIPYQILYRFVHEESVAYGITLKENNKAENYYFSDWDEALAFNFSGVSLEKVYQKLIKAFIRIESGNKTDFKEIIATDNKIKVLEKEISLLEGKINKEKQFNRKVETNKILLEKKAQLKKIKEDVK